MGEEPVEDESTRMGRPRGYIICVVLGLLIGASASFFIGRAMGDNAVRVEAVRAGHARHVIVDDYGNTKFEWLNKPSTQEAPAKP